MPRKPMTSFDVLLRWINVFLRGLHLAAVIWLGAALLGAPLPETLAASAVAVSGLLMFALDLWRKPRHLCEAAGIVMLAKLALVVWMALDIGARAVLFWIIVVGSAISAHAPARFRHAAVLHCNKIH
jgi:hypothetical protein